MARALIRTRTRGAATIEAVIALPVLVLALVAVPYVHALMVAHQDALAEARNTAWTLALDDCSGAQDRALEVTDPGFVDELRTSAVETSRYDSALDIPVIGPRLADFTPRVLSVARNRVVMRPKLLVGGDDKDSVQESIELTCNESAQSARDAALELLWASLP